MPLTDPFNKNVELYDVWYDIYPCAYKAELETIRELLPQGGKGIEIGVGTGRFAVPLGIGIGVEPSPEMGKVAAGRGVRVAEGVAENLPFADESFDFVLMVNVVCFLDDPVAAFKELWRVLKDGGSVLVGFIDGESLLGKSYQANKETSLFYREATFHTPSEILSYLRLAGFADFAFRQTIFRPLGDLDMDEPVKEGYGEGSFVVVRGEKVPLK